MIFNLDSNNQILSNLSKNDIIKYNSESIPEDIFIVYSISVDKSVPAVFIQLWKFSGGYDHAFYNIVENDFGINKKIKLIKPAIITGEIIKFIEYRSSNYSLSEKEKLYFDLYPKYISKIKDNEYNIPYRCQIKSDIGELSIIIPTWTPLQKIPIDKIKNGTKIEIWQIEEQNTLMKVLKL